MNPSPRTDSRFHSLDALRAFALLLGVVWHAAVAFLPFEFGWPIQDASRSWALAVFCFVSHSFRLGLFFLIAGFFAHLLYHRRGPASFVRNRSLRVLIPFVIGSLVVAPLIVWSLCWAEVGGALRGDQLLEGWAQACAKLAAEPQYWFSGTHLWFLKYLFIMYLTVLIARSLFNRISSHTDALRWLDRRFSTTFRSRWGILLLAAPTVLFLWGMWRWGIADPSPRLIPDLPLFLQYGYLFTVGWMLHRQTDLLEALAQRWRFYLSLSVPLLVVSLIMLPIGRDAEHTLKFVVNFVFKTSYGLMSWSLILGSIGAFTHFFREPSAIWRYLSDASYWIYIAHLPLLLFLQVALLPIEMHWTLKLAITNLIVFSLLIVSYAVLVRPTYIGLLLNGRRYPFKPLRLSTH